ncbi:hypothetical protein BASA81_011253 [Batrachochytrium salamandrivorans]|nr:hypothetical protein BASA81_011253 [Batrachochytrium salamandrivorans]
MHLLVVVGYSSQYQNSSEETHSTSLLNFAQLGCTNRVMFGDCVSRGGNDKILEVQKTYGPATRLYQGFAPLGGRPSYQGCAVRQAILEERITETAAISLRAKDGKGPSFTRRQRSARRGCSGPATQRNLHVGGFVRGDVVEFQTLQGRAKPKRYSVNS